MLYYSIDIDIAIAMSIVNVDHTTLWYFSTLPESYEFGPRLKICPQETKTLGFCHIIVPDGLDIDKKLGNIFQCSFQSPCLIFIAQPKLEPVPSRSGLV
jgi:hypothetical protein